MVEVISAEINSKKIVLMYMKTSTFMATPVQTILDRFNHELKLRRINRLDAYMQIDTVRFKKFVNAAMKSRRSYKNKHPKSSGLKYLKSAQLNGMSLSDSDNPINW